MTTKSLLAISMCATALLVNGPAFAAESDSGVFVVAGIGNTDTRFRPATNDLIDDDDTSFELGVGYQFNPYFSVQGSYHDFGKPIGFAGCPPDVLCITAFSPEKVEIDGWSATVNGALPINDRFAVLGKLGVMAWDTSARSPSLNHSDTDLLYGVGLNLNLSPRWDIQLFYEEVNLDIETLKIGTAFKIGGGY